MTLRQSTHPFFFARSSGRAYVQEFPPAGSEDYSCGVELLGVKRSLASAPVIREIAGVDGLVKASGQRIAAVAVSGGVTKKTRVFVAVRRCFVECYYDCFRGIVMGLNAFDVMHRLMRSCSDLACALCHALQSR